MSNILVINASGQETRVALIEQGTISEYYLERKNEKGIVGNIYKGKVVRVLPGMQAAFVDIGLDKAAFLYVGDIVSDPNFPGFSDEMDEQAGATEGDPREAAADLPSQAKRPGRGRAEGGERAGRIGEQRARLPTPKKPAGMKSLTRRPGRTCRRSRRSLLRLAKASLKLRPRACPRCRAMRLRARLPRAARPRLAQPPSDSSDSPASPAAQEHAGSAAQASALAAETAAVVESAGGSRRGRRSPWRRGSARRRSARGRRQRGRRRRGRSRR